MENENEAVEKHDKPKKKKLSKQSDRPYKMSAPQ